MRPSARSIVGATAAALMLTIAGCSQTVEGTAIRAGSPDATAETRIPSPSTRSSTPRSTPRSTPSRTPGAPPPGDTATMTCAEYSDLSPEDQQAVLEDIVAQEGAVFGPENLDIAKSLVDGMCQFFPTMALSDVLLGGPPR